VHLSSNRSQRTSKCGKNISDKLSHRLVCHFLFLPRAHFDVICDLLLDRCTATWDLFVNLNGREALVTVKICVLCGLWFSNLNQFEVGSETPFSCNALGRELKWAVFYSLLCPETDWNIRIGKQGYVFILSDFKGPLNCLLMSLLRKNQFPITLHMCASITPNLDNGHRELI